VITHLILPFALQNANCKSAIFCYLPQAPASKTAASGHVWTTPALQGESDVRLAVGCKSCVRPVCAAPWPLAL